MSDWTPPMLRPGSGNPCRTRMKVYKTATYYGMRWRVFELAQDGQRSSRHEDLLFRNWSAAMAYAWRCIKSDQPLCDELISWMSDRARR